ncbi:MAG: hypothetical protein NTY15_00815 [Planctomycetota bacterium]|nr:hypothetical protein [Planctomycetota bacterium]
MATKPRSESAVNALRMIPTKWAVILLGILIVYVVLQPRLNQWFGWRLPSVASMVGDEKPAKATHKKGESTNNDTNKNETSKPAKKGKDVEPDLEKESKQETASSKKKPAEKTKIVDEADEERDQPINTSGKSENNNPSQPAKTATKPKNESDDTDPLYGFLTEVGRNRYESPAGLVYGPGSEEGHRLKHIARHLEDQPNRPGSHGVFKGGMKPFLTTIDEGYVRAKKGAKGTTKKEDDGSMVYEITFDKAIGFIGGEAGGRKKNPATKKLRLVVRGSNVITAFPF